MARHMFEDIHFNRIVSLLFNCPLDKVDDKTGMKFWTSPKRPPKPIVYTSDDKATCDFIYACANILAYIYGIDEIPMETCMKISNDMVIEEYKPKKATIKTGDDDDVEEG